MPVSFTNEFERSIFGSVPKIINYNYKKRFDIYNLGNRGKDDGKFQGLFIKEEKM